MNIINEIKLAGIIFKLMDESVLGVTARFDGGGDSGDIYEYEFYDYVYEPHDEDFTGLVEDCVYDIITKMVNDYGGDWYNGDGGFGHIELNIKNKTVKGEYNQRTYDEYTWVDNIITGVNGSS